MDFSITVPCVGICTWTLRNELVGIRRWLVDNVGVENQDWAWLMGNNSDSIIIWLPNELLACQCKMIWGSL